MTRKKNSGNGTAFSISKKLYLSLGIVIIGFLVFGSYLFYTFDKLKVNGHVYRQIVAGKDLIADVLPPPDYIIESYLVSFLLLQSIDDEQEVKRLSVYMTKILKNDYFARHAYWVDDTYYLPEEPDIKNAMLVSSYEPAVAFYEVVEKAFLPAVANKDGKLAAEILTGQLKPLYDEHRKHIDTVVKLSTEKNAKIEEEAERISVRNLSISVVLCLLSTILSLVLMFFLSRSIVRPIRVTAGLLKDISEGAGDLTRRIDISSRDEIGDLAGYFNRTIEKVRNLVVGIRRQSETISSTGAALASSMTATTDSVGLISTNIEHIQERIVRQSASIDSTNSNLETITRTIGELDAHIDHQAASVAESSSAIEQMLANISSVTQNLAGNSDNIAGLTAASEKGRIDLETVEKGITEIAADSEKLLDIITVIAKIASRTNLLAMNAAIESAHAGESGKGFAVVSDEIRVLAESSASEAKAIALLIKKSKLSMDALAASAAVMKKQFEDIDTKVVTLAQRESGIRSAMDEQGTGSRQILDQIGQLKEITAEVKSGSAGMLSGSRTISDESRKLALITEEVSGSVAGMAQSIAQITLAVHEVNGITQGNTESIGRLMTELDKFVVD